MHTTRFIFEGFYDTRSLNSEMRRLGPSILRQYSNNKLKMMKLLLFLCILIGVSSNEHQSREDTSLEITVDDRESMFQLFLQPELHHPREEVYLDRINHYVQNQADIEQSSKTPNKHQHHDDYVNLLEEGAHEKVLARVKTSAEMKLFRGALENIKRILQLIVAISVTISEHAYAGIQAGLSLLGLGGGVSVGLSVKLAVIPALANVMSNFFDQYYDENHETSTVLSFLRNFKEQINKLKKVSACSKVGDLFENIMIGFEIGIDISLTRGLMTLGVATVLPTLGLSFGVPVVRIAANSIACLGEMTASGLLYFGDRNPKWMRWSRKGATSLLGASKEIQGFMTIFDVKDAVISVGHGIDIGKGAFGVGLGLTLTCERKKESQKTNAIEACTEALQQIAEKVKEKVSSVIKHALHPNKSKSRRRRLLRQVRKLQVFADKLEGVAGDDLSSTSSLTSLMKLTKEHMNAANSRYQVLHEKEKAATTSTATTTSSAFVEELQLQKVQEKFIFVTTLAIIAIGNGITTALAETATQDAMRDVKGIEDVLAPLTNNAFNEGINEEVQDPRCVDGISAGLDYINWAFGVGRYVGPLNHCFQKACEKVLDMLQFKDVRTKCLSYKTLAGNLLLEKPDWKEKARLNAGDEDQATYRYKINPANIKPSENRIWSGEIDLNWGEKTAQTFKIPNIQSGKQSSMSLQFRVPSGHDVDLHIITTNSDKLHHFVGAYTDCINNIPWNGRINGKDGKDTQHATDLLPEVKNGEDRVIHVGPSHREDVPRNCGGPGRKWGNGFQYKCTDTTNYYIHFDNLNVLQDTNIKFKFTKEKAWGLCTGENTPPVSIGTIVKQVKLPLFRSKYYKVIGRVDERVDETCCSKWCDGMYCSPPTEKTFKIFQEKGIKTEAPSGQCKRTREYFRNQWEERKSELTRIAPKDENEMKSLSGETRAKEALVKKQKEVETAMLLMENDVISKCEPIIGQLSGNEIYKLALIPEPDKNYVPDLKQVTTLKRQSFSLVFEDVGDKAEWIEGNFIPVTDEEKKKAKVFQNPPTFFGPSTNDIPIDKDIVIDNNDAAPDQPSTVASQASKYFERTSGLCTDGGGSYIGIQEDCNERADVFGYPGEVAITKLESTIPPGCLRLYGHKRKNLKRKLLGLNFNTETSSTEPCSSKYKCICKLTSPETNEPVTSEPTQKKDMDTISEEDRTKYLKELDGLKKEYYGVIPTEKLTELYGKYNLDTASLKGRSASGLNYLHDD